MAKPPAGSTIDEVLRGLAAKGLTQSEAARELGVSRQRVSQLKAKLGLSFKPRVEPIARSQLEKLAKKGLTKTEAARQLGVARDHVVKRAAELDLSFTRFRRQPKPAASELGRVLQSARLACGYSYGELATLSGLLGGHIRVIERGLVRRPPDEKLRALAGALGGQTSFEKLRCAIPPNEQEVLEQEVEKLARKGLTRPEAAKQLGVPRDRVSSIGIKLGLTFAPFQRRPKAPATEFGRVMQEARLAAGYSYARTAALSGLHRRHVMHLEMGEILHPTEKTLQALTDALGGSRLHKKLVRATREGAAPVRRGKRRGGHRQIRERAKTK